jgi:hypothetical protein
MNNIKTWQERMKDLGASWRSSDDVQGHCKDAEITDLRAALASQASKGAGVPEDMLKKITQDRDWYKAAHDAASGKLASVWKGIEEAVEKFSGEPCKGEPFDRLDELLTRLAAPSPAQANAGPLPGDMPIDRLIASMPLPTYEPAQAQPVADAAPVDMGLVLAAQRDLTPPAAVQQGSERAQELSEYIDKMQENGDVDIMVDRLQDWLDGDSTNMHAIVKNYEPKANQDSERDAALEDAAKAAEHHELAEKLARMTMANPVGHALSLTRTIAAAIRALATKPADQP